MSDRPSCVVHPSNATFITIRIDYMAICQESPDAACAATLLAYFEGWMNTKLKHKSQAKIRNKIDQDEGKPATQDESLWVYMSQDELKKDLLGVFGDNKISLCLQWLRTANYLFCRENPDHRWDRKLQYMLNLELVQKLINEAASAGEFNIKLSKASKKPVKSAIKNAPEGDNNEAIAKIVLDSQLDSELDKKDSSSLPEEAAPLIAGADSDSHEDAQSPESPAPVEETPVIDAVEQSASQVEAPEIAEISPTHLDAETIAQLELASKIIDEIMGETEIDKQAELQAVIGEAEEIISDKPKKIAKPRERDRVWDGVAYICFNIDAKLSDDNPEIAALIKVHKGRINKINAWLKTLTTPTTAEELWDFSVDYRKRIPGYDIPCDVSKFAKHFTDFRNRKVATPSANTDTNHNNHRRPTDADYAAPDIDLPADALARLGAMANIALKGTKS
jgi:hypothetical protein